MDRATALFALVALSSCGLGRTAPPASNVVLVTIDTMRADRLGSSTPTLEHLAKEGARFTNAFAPSPLTLPSHASILTGTYPMDHGVRDNGRYRLSDEMETLAEMLQSRGFSTAGFVGGFSVDSRFGLHQGFDHYDDALDRTMSRAGLPERRASEVIALARKWIDGRGDERSFVWVHLFDPHAPYEPPAPFGEGYDGEIAYVDHSLKELFDALSEDTLIVVTADHGEGLGEHGESTHSLFVYDSTLRVPLVLQGPRVPPGRVVEEPVSAIDILPTILALLGEEEGCARCQGRSLVPLLEGEVIAPVASYAESFFARLNLGWSELRSLRKGAWKYIAAPEPELFDLESDPHETRNVASANPAKLRELASELEALVVKDEVKAPAADARTVAALRSLGYVMSRSAASPPVSGARPDPKSRLAVWERVREGMELVARGRMDDAIEELEPVVAKEPDLLLARTHLALALFERGRYGESMEQAGAILEREPLDFDATILLGRSLVRAGDRRRARELLRAAAEIDSDSPDPWIELAQLDLLEGVRTQAEAALAKAREKDENAPGVLLLQGKLAMIGGKPSEAEALFRAALAGSPYEIEPRVQLGNLLLAERRLSEAEALYREGLTLRPESAELLLGLGHSRALAGTMDEAIEVLERALELEPGSPMVLNSLAFAYLEAGRRKEGLELLKRSLEIQPAQPELLSLLEQAR